MFYSALIFGLVSSLHCIGMCGPIVLMLPLDRTNTTTKTLQIILYHLGRLSAYAFLGLLFGILGRGLFIAGFQQQLSITVGILMIIMAIVPERQFAKYNFSRPIYKVITKVKSHLGNQFKKKSNGSIFTIGVLNGFLPCGMVYGALFGAVAMSPVQWSVLYMLLFGLGTIPLMSVMAYAANRISNSFRSKLQKIIPVVLILIGILFIIRGLGTGIPFLSPATQELFIGTGADCF